MSGLPSPAAGGEPSRRRRYSRRQTPLVRSHLHTVQETSAGGLVVDRCDHTARVALIGRVDRHGRLEWVLPKGHLEAGETAEQAAIREVWEETGLTSRVVSTVGDIDYWFVAGNRRIHKTVHHFLLEATGGGLSTDDVEVSEVAWVRLDELSGRLRYASERELAHRVRGLLPRPADRDRR